MILHPPFPPSHPSGGKLYLGGEGSIVHVKVTWRHPHIPQYSHLFGDKVHPITKYPCNLLIL